MKKISLILIFILLTASLAACGNSGPATTDGENYDNSNDSENNVSTGSWSEFYESYVAAMENAYTDIEDNISEENFMLALNLFNFMAGDLTLAFTATFFDTDPAAVAMAFSIFGYADIDYSESGDSATVSGTNSSGEPFSYELQYDDSSASAILTCTTNGEVTEVMSICVAEDFYAKTDWTVDYGNVEVVYYTNGDMYMGWDGEPSSPGETLYKNTSYATSSSFAQNLTNSMSSVDGVVTGN